MKRLIHIGMLSLLMGLISAASTAQSFPEGVGYQAVLRDGGGNLISGQNVDVMIRLMAGSIGGTLVYEETHSASTDMLGVVSLTIGSGNSTGGGTANAINAVDWEQELFVEVLVDEAQSGSFTSVAATQLYAVPYAYYAKTTAQTFSLNGLNDIDTTGLAPGDIVIWDGSQWTVGLPSTTLSDSVLYANVSGHATYADTATYAWNAQNIIPSDTANFAWYADSAGYAQTAGSAFAADSAGYADTAFYAMSAPNTWNLDGNLATGSEFIGTLTADDLVFKTNGVEAMRIAANGRVGISTPNPPFVDFQVDGESGFLFKGPLGVGTSVPFGGDRMNWYPRRAHFYIGGSTLTLNDGNIGVYSFGCGYNTRPEGDYSFAMGNLSWARGEASFAGGYNSRADGPYSIAFGRESQTWIGDTAAVALGRKALALGVGSVAMGYHPEVHADHSVSIGFNTRVYASHSVALGQRSNVNHSGCFVYTDQSTSAWYNTTADNQFVVRAAGGTLLYSNQFISTGVSLPASGGAWASLSDSTKKENIAAVDVQDVLAKLRNLEVSEWNYKSQSDDVRHIGPMAQDFYQAFGFGESDTTITTVDADGVNMAALQALIEKTDELEAMSTRLEQSEAELAKMRQSKQDLEARVARMEAMMNTLEELNTVSEQP